MKKPSEFESRWRSLAPRGIRPGLQTLQDVLRGLGSPHDGLSSVLIGGTNGKGSTASLLASMVGAADYEVGLFTSPYLQHPEEQIRIGGDSIAPARLTELWDEVVDVADRLYPGRLTAFEALTAVALLYFARNDVDLAVCEVGMGGRLDSTNVLAPQVSAITSLGLDHAAFLGDTLQQVAAHKAGIFRANRPALLAPGLETTAEALLVEEARAIGAIVIRARQDTQIQRAHIEIDGSQVVDIQTPESTYSLRPSLAGTHQRSNLVTAVRTAETLRLAGWTDLDTDAIERGTVDWRWPGRLERLSVNGRTVLLDAAHNAQGMEALADHLRGQAVPFEVLFGALGDKDVASMLGTLQDARRLWLTQPKSDRAWDANAWSQRIDHPRVLGPWPVDEALRRSLDESGLKGSCPEKRTWLVITGSLRLVGDVRNLLFDQYSHQLELQSWTESRP